MSSIARTRADVDVCSGAKAGAEILERYPADCLVEILEGQGDWCKIKPIRLNNVVSGYVPRRGLATNLAPVPGRTDLYDWKGALPHMP